MGRDRGAPRLPREPPVAALTGDDEGPPSGPVEDAFGPGPASDSLPPPASDSLPPPAPPHPEEEARPVEPSRDVLTCPPGASVRDAARAMGDRGVGSIVVVDGGGRPLGILTDSDLRVRVVAAGVDVDATRVEEVMSAPVRCVPEGLRLVELVTEMIGRRVHHLVVTADGTADAEVIGVLSERDVLYAQGANPTVILHGLRRARRPRRIRDLRDRAETLLAAYLDAEVQMGFVCRLLSEVNDVLVRRCLQLAVRELAAEGRPAPEGVPWAWLALGSEGREEQLLRTDQDNAIVYGDPPEDRAAEVAAWFLELGGRVVDRLEGAGFARCPGDVMASNPYWNQPLSSWRSRFARWVSVPDPKALMDATIAFDFRPVAGDPALGEALRDHVLSLVAGEPLFLARLAQLATRNPSPQGWFGRLRTERGGEHAGTFDLKARAMAPLADAARVLVYDLGLSPWGSTAARWARIGEAVPDHARLARDAALAHEAQLRLRARSGLRRGDSGRYVEVDELASIERRVLEGTFGVVSDVQRWITARYRLELLRG